MSQENWALQRIRVLELADEQAEFAGRLLAGGGADVLKVEPPRGSKTREIGPFYEDVAHPNRSLYFWQYNLGKRGVTLNIETETGRDLLKRLVQRVDVLLESYSPGYLGSLGLGYGDLKAINPRLVYCSVTPFGQTGLYRNFKATDLVHLALGGQMMMCGYDPKDGYDNKNPTTYVYDTPPIAPQMWHAAHMVGPYAVTAILAALYWRDASGGKGQHIDCSIHEACSITTEAAVPRWVFSRTRSYRQTGRHAAPFITTNSQVQAGDGKYVNRFAGNFGGVFEAQRNLLQKANMVDDLFDSKYADPIFRAQPEAATHIQELFELFMATHSAEEVFHLAQQEGLAWAPVRRPEENMTDPHWVQRGVFANVLHPELGDKAFTYLGAPWVCREVPWRVGPRAPLVGEHNLEVYGSELGLLRHEMESLARQSVI